MGIIEYSVVRLDLGKKGKTKKTKVLPLLLDFLFKNPLSDPSGLNLQVLSLHIFSHLQIVFILSSSVLPQAIYVPADDLTDPAPATTFAHLDAVTVLSRGISELGIYPAVDPLDSNSRIMDPNIVGAEHYNVARGVQKVLQVGWGWEHNLWLEK